MLALRAGENGYQRWLVHCTPHFLFFLPEEKEKTGRARSKREKEVRPLRGDGGRGNAQEVLPPGTQVFCPQRSFSGGLEVIEWTSFSFRCR